MGNSIFCKISKGKQLYYLHTREENYFLFTASFRQSNNDVFRKGVEVLTLKKLKSHHSYSVRNVTKKLLAQLFKIEKTYGVIVLERTKHEERNFKHKALFNRLNKYEMEVA